MEGENIQTENVSLTQKCECSGTNLATNELSETPTKYQLPEEFGQHNLLSDGKSKVLDSPSEDEAPREAVLTIHNFERGDELKASPSGNRRTV